MIHLFYGGDEFSLHEELAALKSRLDSDGMLADNTSRLDGRTLQPQELLAHCNTVPFLGAHRLVIVEGLLDRFETGRGSGRRRGGKGSREEMVAWKNAASALEAMPPTTVLVFIDGKISASNPLLRLLAPLAETREFQPLRQRDVPGWLARRARDMDVRISSGAIALLAELVGNDLRVLTQELTKLQLYATGREIVEDDVRLLVSSAREANVLAMVDAVIEGRSGHAARLLEQLRNEGAAPTYLLSMIVRQYRHLIMAKELTLAHLSPAEVGRRLNINSDFALRKVLEQANRYNMGQLERAYHCLLKADGAIKRGVYPGEGEAALDVLLSELAQVSRPPAPPQRVAPRR
ncbi:MAG: DNA polymerase III subunit delta [Dehalococcoidia bacterium]|nr:DNA polymerase III subunit delta [Dehalococcoidia bacterium]